MLNNSTFRKVFGVFGAFLMALNSFAWGPFDKGNSIRAKWYPELSHRYKDPILPYIYPADTITHAQFIQLLDHLSGSQRAELWKVFKGKDENHEATSRELEKQLLWVSSHWATYPFKKEANYHEIVKWTAQNVGVHKAECEGATTFQLERRIMEKVFAQMWDKLTPEQRKKILEESGLVPNDAAGLVSLGGAAALAALATMPVIFGFTFYIIMAKTVVVIAAATLGLTAPAVISAIAVLCGPIGWCIAGGSALFGSALLGRANVMKTAAFIIALHAVKATAMTKSNEDITPYVLK